MRLSRGGKGVLFVIVLVAAARQFGPQPPTVPTPRRESSMASEGSGQPPPPSYENGAYSPPSYEEAVRMEEREKREKELQGDIEGQQ